MKPTILTPPLVQEWKDDEDCFAPRAWRDQFIDAMNAIHIGHTEVITREQAELNREAWALIERMASKEGGIAEMVFAGLDARALIAKRKELEK